MYQQLVDDLALQIRDYPRNGGQRPDGMKILQRGGGRKTPDASPKNSSVPTEVAEILMGMQFDKRKVVASSHIHLYSRINQGP